MSRVDWNSINTTFNMFNIINHKVSILKKEILFLFWMNSKKSVGSFLHNCKKHADLACSK